MGWDIKAVVEGFKEVKGMINKCGDAENLTYLKKELLDLAGTVNNRLEVLGRDESKLYALVEVCKRLPFHLLDLERQGKLDAADIEYHFEVILGVMREIREQLLEILDG